ncbi:MFS transporter [Microbacterium keratanolyticum]
MSQLSAAHRAQAAPPARAWVMLVAGLLAQASGTLFVSTPAFLIPYLHAERGVSLAEGGMLAAAPTLGLVLTMVLWGALADRFGERLVIALGLALTALPALGAAMTTDLVQLGFFLFLGGAASASVNAASGRVVIGWFPRDRRGFAMGIRQMSQPLGVSAAAILVPLLLDGYGMPAALLLSAVLNGVFAVLCAIIILNPPHIAKVAGPVPVAAVNPYRGSSFLWRIHAVSGLLVIPQFALSIFGVVWLVTDLGWDATLAGLLIAAAQFIGAISRLVIGGVSDRVGSRVRVLRWVAIAGCFAMLALGLAGFLRIDALAAIIFIAATVVSVLDNGIAFTAVAEAAGHGWAGRALGVQNTGQFLLASAVGPAFGALITLVGAPWALTLLVLAPAAAFPLIPSEDRSALAEDS